MQQLKSSLSFEQVQCGLGDSFEGVGFGDVDPVDVAKGLEPRALGFGQFSGVDFNLLDSVLKRTLSIQAGDDFGVSDGGAGLFAHRLWLGQQCLDLIKKPLFDHLLDPLIDSAAFDGLRAQPDDKPVLSRPAFPLFLQGADRSTCQFEHLQCTDDAPPVIRVDPLGGLGVDVCQPLVQGRRAESVDLVVQMPPKCRIRSRALQTVRAAGP